MKAINTFYGIEFNLSRTTSYGRYVISAHYRGKDIKVETTDSEAYDWYNDDSNTEKHMEALRHCYWKIRTAWEDSRDYIITNDGSIIRHE